MPRLPMLRQRALMPVLVWAATAAIYVAVTGARREGPTPDNHFVHLAQSLLNGQLGVLGNIPPGTNDWACYDSETRDICPPAAFRRPSDTQHWYISFPPFPAIVILPAVALFGPNISDALFWAIFAGLGPALLFMLLRRLRESGHSNRTLRDDLLLTVLFAFGTVYFFSAVQGTVWFAAHIVGTSLIILYLYLAWDARSPLLAGLMLGLAFMTRPTTAALAIFFALEAVRVSNGNTRTRIKEVFARYLMFAAPILVIGALAMWMNEARWENPFEFGHRYLMIRWRERIETWGLFNYHYLSKNLAVFLASLPWFTAHEPHVIISRHGLALWVTTPALLLILWPKRVNSTMVALYLSAGAVALWNLLYQNSGWIQFGYRFALDYMPLLFVLLALGNRRFGGGFIIAMIFAVAVNTFGAITFDRAYQFYDDDSSQDRLFQPD